MVDPAPVLAPAVSAETITNFNLAIKGQPIPAIGAGSAAESAAIANGTAPPRTGQPTAITMDNVGSSAGGNTVGAEIVAAPRSTLVNNAAIDSGVGGGADPNAGAATGTAAPAGEPASNTVPAAGGGAVPAANPMAVYGLTAPVGPNTAGPLPPVDKPAAEADQINDVKSGGPAQVTTGAVAGKTKKKHPKPAFDSKDESSSKHKPKKGIDKINPL